VNIAQYSITQYQYRSNPSFNGHFPGEPGLACYPHDNKRVMKRVFICGMPFLSPSWQCQSTEELMDISFTGDKMPGLPPKQWCQFTEGSISSNFFL